MMIDDEKLGAFLDAELPETEMNAIREQLAHDEPLSERLAQLALADQWVRQHAADIDREPLPAAITALLNESQSESASEIDDKKNTSTAPSNVIALSRWRRLNAVIENHGRLAAAIALMIGFGVASLTLPGRVSPDWAHVSAVLDATPSGQTQSIANDEHITALLSFRTQSGELCRQYRHTTAQQTSTTIACKSAGDSSHWQIVATLFQQPASDAATYQVAGQHDVAKALIDQLIVGDFLDAAQEQQAIEQRWQKPASNKN